MEWQGTQCTASQKLVSELREAMLAWMLQAGLQAYVARGRLPAAHLALLRGAKFVMRCAPAAAQCAAGGPGLALGACATGHRAPRATFEARSLARPAGHPPPRQPRRAPAALPALAGAGTRAATPGWCSRTGGSC
jgi:hypothetical protein